MASHSEGTSGKINLKEQNLMTRSFSTLTVDPVDIDTLVHMCNSTHSNG